jgi:hypothetical protein
MAKPSLFDKVLIFFIALVVLLSRETFAIDLQFNAFGSIIAGYLQSGDNVNLGNRQCPCFIADWANGFSYNHENQVDFTPETRAGLQAKVEFTQDLSATAQVVARTGDHKADLEWAYLTYHLSPVFTVQAGQMRIPLYYYSQFQDFGYDYIWVRPPQELYGWEIQNYDGAVLRYQDSFKGLSVTSSVYGGYGKVKNSGYFSLFYSTPVTAWWDKIFGVDLELGYKWLTTRFIYMQNAASYDMGFGRGDVNFNIGDIEKQRFYGITNNFDFGSLFALSELSLIHHDSPDINYESLAWSFGAGYHFKNNLTPFINFSKYKEATTSPLDVYDPWSYSSLSYTLRWDFAKNQDVKLQYTIVVDYADPKPMGNSQLISASYDFWL